jgi:aspartate aminotransferase-like enzyme
MPGLLPDLDPEGLLEYSVVFSDRSLNHMSQQFQQVMRDLSSTLKQVYHADETVLVPGGGTYAMEAVARQFATDQPCLVVRNGWFSYRWSQILETGSIPSALTVMKAKRLSEDSQAPFTPPQIDAVTDRIRKEQPGIVFAPHVETSAGMLLPDEYIKSMAEAVHAHGGLLALDCIASGALWVDMKALGVDTLISAPQKGWSGTPCAGVVMLSDRAAERMQETQSSSFACNLKQWHGIMKAYEKGGHAYHATLPTDGLKQFRDVMAETEVFGFDKARQAQLELGQRVRDLLEKKGFPSVAAAGFQAPGVVVSYTEDPAIHDGSKFREAGVQIAKGVPLACDEPADFQTFRVGLFGLDKLMDVDGTVSRFENALSRIG